jgi:hypothetical protein
MGVYAREDSVAVCCGCVSGQDALAAANCGPTCGTNEGVQLGTQNRKTWDSTIQTASSDFDKVSVSDFLAAAILANQTFWMKSL